MPEHVRKLVAGVGTLREMDPVIPAAAAFAERAALPLELVHAFDVSDPFVESYLRSSNLPGDPLQRYSEGLQARLEGQVGGLGGRGEVHCRAVAGAAPGALREAAQDAGSLLVVGPTRRGRAAAILGTTARRVLHDTRAPVLVLRGDLPLPPRVLFCVDVAWPGAAAVVEEGLALIDSLSGGRPVEARALLVVGLEADLPIAGLRERLTDDAGERLGEFLRELPGGERLAPRIRIGAPAREALAEAAEWPADLIVMGTRGRTGLPRALLGSVAESVVRDAPCSALVVPGPGGARS